MKSPVPGYDKQTYIRPTIKNPNIITGDFSYFADQVFESHVTHFYPWSKDKLVIGKLLHIAFGVEFMIDECNHKLNVVSTYPFFTIPFIISLQSLIHCQGFFKTHWSKIKNHTE